MTPSFWFEKGIPEAIASSEKLSIPLAVFIQDESQESIDFEGVISKKLSDISQTQSSSPSFIAIRISSGTVSFEEFSAYYPVLAIPCLYFIKAATGVPLEILTPALTTQEVQHKIEEHTTQLQSSEKDVPISTPLVKTSSEAKNECKREEPNTRIQFKLCDGRFLTKSFPREQTLCELYSWLKPTLASTYGIHYFDLIQPYFLSHSQSTSTRLLNQDVVELKNSSLEQLKLHPSACLFVVAKKSAPKATSAAFSSLFQIVSFPFQAFLSLFDFLASLLSKIFFNVFSKPPNQITSPTSSMIPNAGSAAEIVTTNPGRSSSSISIQEGNVFRLRSAVHSKSKNPYSKDKRRNRKDEEEEVDDADDGDDSDENGTWNGNSTQQQ